MTTPASPFTHHRRITFADTDAANIAYTGRFPNFALDAIDAWFVDRLHTDWYRLNNDHGLGTPFVHLDMDFASPLTPRDELATIVRLTKAGRSALTFTVTGRVGERIAFTGTFVCVFVARATGKSCDIPEPFRARVLGEAALSEAKE
jgi:acyl-CoA thioesterase FadM